MAGAGVRSTPLWSAAMQPSRSSLITAVPACLRSADNALFGFAAAREHLGLTTVGQKQIHPPHQLPEGVDPQSQEGGVGTGIQADRDAMLARAGHRRECAGLAPAVQEHIAHDM